MSRAPGDSRGAGGGAQRCRGRRRSSGGSARGRIGSRRRRTSPTMRDRTASSSVAITAPTETRRRTAARTAGIERRSDHGCHLEQMRARRLVEAHESGRDDLADALRAHDVGPAKPGHLPVVDRGADVPVSMRCKPQLDEEEGVAVGLAGEHLDGRPGGRPPTGMAGGRSHEVGDPRRGRKRAERQAPRRRADGAARAVPTAGPRRYRPASIGTNRRSWTLRESDWSWTSWLEQIDVGRPRPVQVVEYQEQRPVGGELGDRARSRRRTGGPARRRGRRDLTGSGRPSSAAC